MSTRVQKTITVNVPLSTAYNQWTQFEDFPQFMDGVKSVSQQTDNRLAWVAEIAGVRRQWEARVLEQVPAQKIAWAATEGATNAGTVSCEAVDGNQISVSLTLDDEPEGLVGKLGDASRSSNVRSRVTLSASRPSSRPRGASRVHGVAQSTPSARERVPPPQGPPLSQQPETGSHRSTPLAAH